MSTGGGTGGGAPGSVSISPADELFSIAQSRTEPGPRREAELARARQLLGAHKVCVYVVGIGGLVVKGVDGGDRCLCFCSYVVAFL